MILSDKKIQELVDKNNLIENYNEKIYKQYRTILLLVM